MPLSLFTAVLLSQPQASQTFTAREMYDGCGRVLAGRPASSHATDAASASEAVRTAICDATIAMELALHAANEAIGDSEPGRRQNFCPPESVLNSDDPTPALARAYIAWFEQHPADQNAADGGLALSRALAETWPCPG